MAGRWRIGYKKILRRHVIALNELQKCFDLQNETDVYSVIDDFIKVCNHNYEIGKFYRFLDKPFSNMKWNNSYDEINRIIDEIF